MADAIDDLDEFLKTVNENGAHLCKLEFINPRNGKDGKNWIVTKFSVDDEESPFQGEEYELWIRDRAHLTTPDYLALPAKEKTNVRKDKKKLKSTLVSLGFSEDEADEIMKDPKADIRKEHNGDQYWVTVRISGDESREFKNIDNVTPVTDDDGNAANPPF